MLQRRLPPPERQGLTTRIHVRRRPARKTAKNNQRYRQDQVGRLMAFTVAAVSAALTLLFCWQDFFFVCGLLALEIVSL
jgi:hypothetical protein